MKKDIFKAPVIKLSDRVGSDIQVLRIGKFQHAVFGEFEITKKMLRSMVKNFQDQVRGVDLAIDYAHENDQRAAGWITDLHVRNDGIELWAEVDWTDTAKRSLDDKEWRYISAEFTENFIDNESKKEFGPTLFGAALTNRPFVKGMAPAVELSEQLTNEDEMGTEEIKTLQEANHKLNVDVVKLGGELAGWKVLGETPQAVSKKLTQLETANKTLKKEKEEIEADAKKAARANKFNELMKAGKITKSQEEFILSLSDEQLIAFEKTAQKVATNDEPKGNGGSPKSDLTDNVEAKVLDLAEKRAEKDKITVTDAISLVLAEDPELAKKYV